MRRRPTAAVSWDPVGVPERAFPAPGGPRATLALDGTRRRPRHRRGHLDAAGARPARPVRWDERSSDLGGDRSDHRPGRARPRRDRRPDEALTARPPDGALTVPPGRWATSPGVDGTECPVWTVKCSADVRHS